MLFTSFLWLSKIGAFKTVFLMLLSFIPNVWFSIDTDKKRMKEKPDWIPLALQKYEMTQKTPISKWNILKIKFNLCAIVRFHVGCRCNYHLYNCTPTLHFFLSRCFCLSFSVFILLTSSLEQTQNNEFHNESTAMRIFIVGVCS